MTLGDEELGVRYDEGSSLINGEAVLKAREVLFMAEGERKVLRKTMGSD